MNTQLDKLFNSLETQRHQLLRLANGAADRFNDSPSNNKWSLHQILAHLVAAEKLSIQYLGKKIQGIDSAEDSGIAENLKMIVLKASQRLPLKFNAPKPIVASTMTYNSLEELITEWDHTRAELKMLLENIKDDQLKRKVFKHVIVGKLNILQALQFLREHINHHLPQVKRLLK